MRRKRPSSTKEKWNIKKKQNTAKKAKKWLNAKKVKIAALCLLLVLFFYVLFFSNVFRIQKLVVTTNQPTLNAEAVQNLVEPKILGKNLFLFGQEEIQESIKEKFLDISAVKTIRTSLTSIELEISGFDLVAIVKQNGTRYYLNENGILVKYHERNISLPVFTFILRLREVHEEAEEQSDPVLLPQQLEKSAAATIIESKLQPLEKEEQPKEKEKSIIPVAGTQLMNRHELSTLLKAIEELQQQTDLKVSQLKYIQLGRELHLKTSKGYWIILDTSADIGEQISKLKKSLTVLNPLAIERIDVSIEGRKVFYTEKK